MVDHEGGGFTWWAMREEGDMVDYEGEGDMMDHEGGG